MAPVTTPAAPAMSLRERKKIKTRQAIRAAAYRLFREQGYDETTVEQIAAAAEVSPSTFFRYFPVKEDVVLTDEYDPLVQAAIEARPADEPIVESMRKATLTLLRRMMDEDRDIVLLRMRLVRNVPAVRARMAENLGAHGHVLVSAFARRAGRPEDDFELRVIVAALLGAWNEALMHWVDTGAQESLPDLLDSTLTILSAGLSERR